MNGQGQQFHNKILQTCLQYIFHQSVRPFCSHPMGCRIHELQFDKLFVLFSQPVLCRTSLSFFSFLFFENNRLGNILKTILFIFFWCFSLLQLKEWHINGRNNYSQGEFQLLLAVG